MLLLMLPQRVPHVFTTPSSPDTARCWVPCVDNLWEKCTWDFEFTVPRSLEQQDSLSDDEDEGAQTDYPTIVVCSGELVEQVCLDCGLTAGFSPTVLHTGFASL